MATVAEAFSLAVQHHRVGNLRQAEQLYQQILRLQPDCPEAHNALGLLLPSLGRLEEAVTHCRQALHYRPEYPEAHNNLANALHLQDKLDEAVAHYHQALRLMPHYAEAHNNLGLALTGQAKLDEALAHYRQCLETRPDFAGAHWNRSLLWLLRGNFEQGWQEYEWRRWTLPEFTTRPFSQPLWDGSALSGRTILLVAEQGLGDTLQSIRYAPLVKQRGGTVIVECLPPLLRLLAGFPGIDRLVARGSPLPAFDVQAPLLSLPRIFHTALATIPRAVPYLRANPQLVEHWRKSPKSEVRSPKSNPSLRTSDFGLRTSDFLVGLAWQGSPTYRYDRQRSIPLAHFARLAKAEGVQLISLQKGPGTEQLGALAGQLPVLDLGSRLDEGSGAFMDTAAIMMNLDLVISSDTAIPHLAGALGVPAWVALPLVPNWRWLLEREDSPWYPTMRLFRQTRQGQWEDVFERMAEELKAVVSC